MASETLGFTLSLPVGTQVGSRVRGIAEVVLDVTTSGSTGAFALTIGHQNGIAGTQTFPITQGSNAISFDFPIGQDYGISIDVPFAVVCLASSGAIASAWASLHVTQCDVLLNDTGTVTTSAVTMTPFAVIGNDNAGSGGGHIAKAGALTSATTIEIVGYYPSDAGDLAVSSSVNFYAQRWANEADFVAVPPPAAIPVFGAEPPAGSEGDWGWIDGDAFDATIPANQWSICKVKIDGGTPVFALLPNPDGY